MERGRWASPTRPEIIPRLRCRAAIAASVPPDLEAALRKPRTKSITGSGVFAADEPAGSTTFGVDDTRKLPASDYLVADAHAGLVSDEAFWESAGKIRRMR